MPDEYSYLYRMTPRTVALHTLGCKLNFSETSSVGRLFEDAGYGVVPFNETADIYVLNTCSVTDFADKKCRQIVRKVRRQNEDAHVIVMGCYAQLKPQEIADMPGVDMVLGAAEKFRIVELLDELEVNHDRALVFASDIKEAHVFTHAHSYGDRTRSFLKVQDGCDYKCSFCTIPLARGASRSDTITSVVQRAEEVAAQGVKEIVLTGVNLGDFGNGTEVIEGLRPKKEALFIDLIRALDEVEGIDRYRISSIEPNLLTEEIIEFVAQSNRFMPHFHIPLQSGNDKQLKQMRRRYKRSLYADRVNCIRKHIPHASIGVDVIVGFPGETDDDFLESFSFIRDLDVSYLHVFTYSERANTSAATMEHSVPMNIRRERNKQLRILSDKKRRAFYTRHLGNKRSILLEKSKQPGLLRGHTDNYIDVYVPETAGSVNDIIYVTLNELSAEGNISGSLS